MKRLIPIAAAGLVLAASVAFAQPQGSGAETPKQRNLQVFPQAMPQEQLIAAMQGFTRALGVNCSHCHVPGNFASDENPNKNVARGMLRLTMRLNQELLPAIPGLEQPRVSCFTCHRGAAEPGVDLPAAAAPKG